MAPKKQKRAAKSDSPPAPKKAKPGAASAAPAPATLFTNDLFRVELAPRSLKYLAVATFEGKPPKPKKGQKKEDVKPPVMTAASIRLFYRKGTGAIEPTQKGTTLTSAGLRALAQHGPEVAAAVAAGEPASFVLDETPRARKLLSSTEWPLGSGKYHADVREWYAAKDGGWGATQKGVSLTAAELAAAVEQCWTRGRRRRPRKRRLKRRPPRNRRRRRRAGSRMIRRHLTRLTRRLPTRRPTRRRPNRLNRRRVTRRRASEGGQGMERAFFFVLAT